MNRPEQHFRARLAVLVAGGALIAALFPMAGSVLAAPPAITAATGGTAISADSAGTATYTTLSGPSIVGTAADVIGAGTLTLTIPTGFVFKAATGSAVLVGGVGCDTLAISSGPTVTTTTVSVTTTGASTGACSLDLSGLQVQPTAGTPLAATGNIVASGLVAGNAGALTEVAGAADNLNFSVEPGGGSGGTAWVGQPVVQVRDQFNTVRTQDNASSVALAIVNNAGPGGILTCTGGNSKVVTAGVATFAGCAIDKTGTAYTLSATSGAIVKPSAAFNITLGAAAKLAFTNTAIAAAAIGGNLVPQPVVTVQDAGGNTVTGSAAAVTLAIKAGTPSVGGPGALACTTNPVTASAGVATFAGCKINTNSGTGYMLHATSGALTAADSTAFNITSGAATKLAFSTQPGGGTAGLAWTNQPVVQVQDASGNVVITDNTTVVTLAIGTNPGAGTLTCTGGLTKTVVSGQAAFAGCSISKVGAGYTLVATSSPVYTLATSSAFTVAVGTATKLGFTSQPGTSSSNVAFTIQPVVAIQDAGGNTITTAAAATVTLSLGVNPSAGTLTCTGGNTRTTSLGVATFSGCAINNAGVGYTLVASATGYTSATSTAFDVTAPGATITLTRSRGMITYGESVTFSVQFGAGGGNRPFVLEYQSVGVPFATIASLTTNASGFASFSYIPKRTGYVRARFAGTTDLGAANSTVFIVGVRQTVTLSPHHTGTLTIARGRSVAFRVTVRPIRADLAASSVTFRFYRKVSGSWVLQNERHLLTDSTGVARTTFRFGSSGGWYVRAYAPRTPYNSISRFTQREFFSVR